MNESLSALYMRDPETAAILRRQAMAQQLARAQNPEIMYRSAASPWVAGLQALAGNLGSYMAERDLGDLSQRRNAEANEFMANALAGVMPGMGQGASPQPQQAPQGAPARMGGAAIPAGSNYVANTVAVENNPSRPDYRPDARNPRSSATGDGQFIDATWMEFAAANPQRFQGMSRDQILAARGNPELSREAISWYAQRNAPALQGAGVPVNDTTLALAHRFGPGDAPRVIQADPNTPMERIVSAQVMQANPDLQGRTAGQVVQQYGQRFGSGTTAAPQDAAPAGGQQAPAQAGGLSRERLVMAAMQGINSNNPVVAERARQLLQMAQALPQAPQRQFTTAAPGSAIVDNQGNVVGQIPERASEDERRMSRWRELAARGENVTPQEAEERNILARRLQGSGVSVNVDTRAETAEATRRGTSLGEEGERVRLAAETAAQTIDGVRQVRALGPNTDRLAPAREIIGGYLEALGVPPAQSRLVREASTLQAFNAAANNIVLGRQLEQRGVQTDGDREVMRQTFATITNTNEANDTILRAVEAQANRAMERAEFYQQWRQQTGPNGRPRGTLDGASEAWNAYIRETPLVARTGSGGLVFFNEWLPAALQNPQINGDREAALRLWRENARQRR